MRVVAGELKGRRLASPGSGAEVRPTADRVREALFSILGDVSGLRVLDLFCGTGALGIEALSRGAASATLVDTDTGLAARNVAGLALGNRARLVRADASAFLRGVGPAFDLILCDPPYRLAARLEAQLQKLVPGRLAPHGRLVAESDVRRPLDLEPPLVMDRERRYGDTLLRVWSKPA